MARIKITLVRLLSSFGFSTRRDGRERIPRRQLFRRLLFVAGIGGLVTAVWAWTPVPVSDDPLVRMPGTQPGQVSLQAPTRCLNCHAGYDPAVEPGFNWQGSMMAQSARDFLFWSCLTVGAQDSLWAVGTPNATDICVRCHFPKGWLEGRSDPTSASLMTGADFDGVQCDFCHRMWDPNFEKTYAGTNEGSDWLGYWDETNASGTPSQSAADETYAADSAAAQSIVQFDGTNFFTNNQPPANYTEPDVAARSDYASNGGEKLTQPNAAGIWPQHCGNGDCGPPVNSIPDRETLEAKARQMYLYGANGIVHILSTVRISPWERGVNRENSGEARHASQISRWVNLVAGTAVPNPSTNMAYAKPPGQR